MLANGWMESPAHFAARRFCSKKCSDEAMRGQRRKTEPTKFCAACGAILRRRIKDGRLEDLAELVKRKFCDRRCMARGFRGRFKQNVHPHQGRYRARTLVTKVACYRCGTTTRRLDVHHVDGNTLNNEPSNLMVLCRPCHLREEGRVGRPPCKVCGRSSTGLGYCDKHYQRFKKYGDPLMWKRNQHTPLIRKEN